jgi:hypothetical protein
MAAAAAMSTSLRHPEAVHGREKGSNAELVNAWQRFREGRGFNASAAGKAAPSTHRLARPNFARHREPGSTPGAAELEPTRASRNTQPMELRFRALLGREPKVEVALV